MNYTTYFLKFTSETEFEIKFDEVGYKFIDEETETTYYRIPDAPGDIDIIGIIYNNDSVYDENGELITPSTQKEGFHVNIILKGELPESLQEYSINPQNPYRIFA
jgi:hypothetical protein